MALFMQVIINIEDKDGESPSAADPDAIVQRLQDTLVDVTKHDDTTDWMVRWVALSGVIKG